MICYQAALMKPEPFDFTRTRVIEMTRLHHVLYTLSSLYYGEPGGTWQGNTNSGSYSFNNGSGDRFDFAWNADSLVGLVFAHESGRAVDRVGFGDHTPLRWLHGICEPARSLASKTAMALDNLVTAGLWTEGKRVQLSDRVNSPEASNGIDLIAGFGLSPDEAIFGRTTHQNWLELSSLTPAHGGIALRLAASENAQVTVAEQDLLLELPLGCETLAISAAQRVRRELASIGITWTVPRKRILELCAGSRTERRRRIASALDAPERELFDAARSNDPAKVVALLAAGAQVDARTIEDQWPYTPAGDTPLIQACKSGARNAALELVRGGADPNAHNVLGQTGLLWAAEAGFREVVDACLAAGADPNLTDSKGNAALLWAAQGGDTEMVDSLLRAGADVGHRSRRGLTAGEVAGKRGHAALARRLR